MKKALQGWRAFLLSTTPVKYNSIALRYLAPKAFDKTPPQFLLL